MIQEFDDYRLLGDLGSGSGAVSQIVGAGGGIASGLIPLLSTSAAAGPIGLAVGVVAGLIASIFAKHAARVKAENEVTGVWADTGQKAITETMNLWRAGKVPSNEVIAGLRSIENQFKELTRSVAKYKGKFGVFPDPEAPRPSRDCNASCGMYWDLHQQIKALIAEVQARGDIGGGAGISAALSSVVSKKNLPLLLIGGAVLYFMTQK